MIDIRKLKELVRLMVANELTELDLRDSEEQVTLRRGGSGSPVIASAPPVLAAAANATPASPESGGAATPGEEDDGLLRIESPMVGTFYTAPNPDSPAFVGVGSEVGPDTGVCIVEAMKIFNEIKAECSGTIQRVVARNGEPVEFGQVLFLVKPS